MLCLRWSLAWYNTAVPATRADAPALQIQRIARPGPGVVGDMTGRPPPSIVIAIAKDIPDNVIEDVAPVDLSP